MRLSAVLGALLVNLVVVVAVFASLYLAAGWGEMAGIPAGGDKSGLGGLFGMLILMGIRWGAVALLLTIAVANGAFALFADGRWSRLALVLGLHAALGLVSFLGFNAVADGLARDDLGPQRWSPLLGIVLPLPALLAAGWGANRGLGSRHPRIALLLATAIAVSHFLIYRERHASMRPLPPAGSTIEPSSAPS